LLERESEPLEPLAELLADPEPEPVAVQLGLF
jgi:hypothetical protein